MNSLSARVLAAVIQAVLALTPVAALCQVIDKEIGDSGTGEQVAVMIIAQGQEDQEEDLVRAVQGQLAELDAVLVVQRVTRFPRKLADRIEMAEKTARLKGAAIVFWREFDQRRRVFLFITSPTGERMLVRGLSERSGGQVHEDAAIIVRSSLEALTRGGEIGVAVTPSEIARVESESKEDAPPEAENDPPKRPGTATTPKMEEGKGEDEMSGSKGAYPNFAFAAAYGFWSVSSREPWVSGFDMRLGVNLNHWLQVGATTRFSNKLSQVKGDVKVTSGRIPVLLGAAARGRLGRWRLGGSAHLGVDVLTVEGKALSDDWSAEGRRSFAGMSCEITFDALFGFGDKVWLFFAFGMDIPLVKDRYLVEINGKNVEANGTWAVIPVGVIGFEFSVY